MQVSLRAPLEVGIQRDVRTWGAVGFAACAVMAIVGTRLGNLPENGNGHWWLSLPSGGGGIVASVLWALFYGALIALGLAWLKLGQLARNGELTVRTSVLILLAWSLPLLLGPPLFSGDVYSYAAQGTLAQEGLNPYQMGPIALIPGPVMHSVASVWLYTPAPYGPLFVILAKFIVIMFGKSLIYSVTAFRFLGLIGALLMARYLPRLAISLGADPARAVWLGVLSPVSLISFVASGHNDSLMLGLMVAGVALAMENRRVLALLVCSLAVGIKVPALAGIGFIAISWMLEQEKLIAKCKVLAISTASVVAVLASLTMISGFGWAWLSPSTLSTPTDITLPSAPVAAIALTLTGLLHSLGAMVPAHALVSVSQLAGGIAAVTFSAVMLLRARGRLMPEALGVSLMAVVALGPIVWPWYLTWGLVLLAATTMQDTGAFVWIGLLGAAVLLPEGSPILVGPSYLGIAVAAIGLSIWSARTGRWRALVPGIES